MPGAQAKEEGLRDKIAAQKDKREMQKKLSEVVTLGSRSESDDVAAWVEKHRVMEVQKAAAAKKNKELEEMEARLAAQVPKQTPFSRLLQGNPPMFALILCALLSGHSNCYPNNRTTVAISTPCANHTSFTPCLLHSH